MKIKVVLTFAQSIDGRIATSTGASRYISERASLKLNQQMRKENDAILVGIGTVLKDNPLLTCRIADNCNPLRVVLDPSLKIPLDSAIVSTASEVKTLIFYNSSDKEAGYKIRKLQDLGIQVKGIPAAGNGKLDLLRVVDHLEQNGVGSLMVEGGSAILTAFLRESLWDELVIVSAPRIIGDGIPSFGRLGVESLDDALVPEVKDIKIMGNEVVWHLVKPAPAAAGNETRTVYFSAPGEVEVKFGLLKNSRPGERLLTSRIMAISPGTERQMFLGNFEQGKASDPSIDCVDTVFNYPFSYGYINVLEDENKDRFFGFLPHTEKVFADPESLLPLDDDISDETALFIPHMETALSIIHDTRPQIGDRILIVGAGVVGTLTFRILTQMMGMDTYIFDINPKKAGWFEDGNFYSNRTELEKSGPFDRCIDVSGSPKGLQSCIDLSCFEGTITAASWFGEVETGLNLGGAFHRKRLTMKSSQVSNMSSAMGSGWNKKRRLIMAAELLKKVGTADLLTHKFGIGSAQEAFGLLEKQDELYGLIALIPGG